MNEHHPIDVTLGKAVQYLKRQHGAKFVAVIEAYQAEHGVSASDAACALASGPKPRGSQSATHEEAARLAPRTVARLNLALGYLAELHTYAMETGDDRAIFGLTEAMTNVKAVRDELEASNG